MPKSMRAGIATSLLIFTATEAASEPASGSYNFYVTFNIQNRGSIAASTFPVGLDFYYTKGKIYISDLGHLNKGLGKGGVILQNGERKCHADRAYTKLTHCYTAQIGADEFTIKQEYGNKFGNENYTITGKYLGGTKCNVVRAE